MMKKKQNNEVYILGSEQGKKKTMSKLLWVILGAVLLAVIVALIMLFSSKEQAPDYYFEPEQTETQPVSVVAIDTVNKTRAYIEVAEETINDVPLKFYMPHHASMSLMTGAPDAQDSTIVFAAMAADIRKDNMQIVGDFVLAGNRLARGVAKKGFVAIVNNEVTIGVGESTPLLQQTIDQGGSFFRQYPLVHNGELIENKPKNKSIRRALAVRAGQIVMVESENRESFHDFSQALVDAGVSNAVYLVGGNSYGWFYTPEYTRCEFGEKRSDLPETISYIVWK